MNRLIRSNKINCCDSVLRKQLSSCPAQLEQTNTGFDAEWKAARAYDGIPGPTAIQVLRGFLPGGKYHKQPMTGIHSRLRDEFGPLVKFPSILGQGSFLFSFDPNDFELIFRTEGKWPIRRGLDTFIYFSETVRPDVFKGNSGLINEQDEAWRKLRTKLNPIMMQPSVVRSYIPELDAVARDFLDHIRVLRDRSNEVPTNFGSYLNKWALESVGVIALNQRLGVLTEGSADAKLFNKYVQDFFRVTNGLSLLPSLWHYVQTPNFRAQIRAFDKLTNLTIKYIDCAPRELDSAKTYQSGNVLENLLRVDRSIAVLTTLDMFLAGVNTISSAIVGCLYHLAMNPDQQEQLRQEIRAILPDVDSKLSADSLASAPYLRACVKEASRLSPVFAGNNRELGANLVLQGYQIPKGVEIDMAGSLLQLDETYCPQSKQFVPERWLKRTDPLAANRLLHPFAFLPFGFGSRSCIGKRFADMKMEILLCRIICKYEIKWIYGPIKYGIGQTQIPISVLKFQLIEIDK